MGRLIDTMGALDIYQHWQVNHLPTKQWIESLCKPVGSGKGSDSAYLDDLDRGNYDCQHGNQAEEGESDAYYTGYGARYVYEQMATHNSEGANQ